MATIKVKFNVPDGEYCTTANFKCKFRTQGYVKNDRFIIECRLFGVELTNTEYENREKSATIKKCQQCLNAHIHVKRKEEFGEEASEV